MRIVAERQATAQVTKPGAYLTATVRALVAGRREAATVGQRKQADRRAEALAYARSILADPVIGSLTSARAIVAESYGAELAAEIVAELA